MIISLNWLKKFTSVDLPVDQLAERIGERLVEIEDVVDLGARYDGVLIAKVARVYKHPQANKLNVVEIDDGGSVQGVSRLDNGLIQVVCGAPNVRKGLLIAWIRPGAIVPATFSDQKPVVLEARELRGVMSNGMIASGKELVINDDHSGIAELEGDFVPGSPLAPALELDDYLLHIENKSLTHRPDCFGLIGFAREVAAIQGKQFTTPDWMMALDPILKQPRPVEGVQAVKVTIENSTMCPRYQAAVIAGVDIGLQSPLIIQSYLKRQGIRPINAVVDVTNYLMLATGQPLHAFDYDKVVEIQGGGAPHIRVRGGQAGDTLTLLDGRTVEPTKDDIVICAGDTPVALAGAMGGKYTEIGPSTRRIILESASFNLYNLRGTSMRHGIFSEAATRFTKGQAAAQTAPVLASAVRMTCDIAGGSLAAALTDAYPAVEQPITITVQPAFINATLGSGYAADAMAATLLNVNCPVERQDDELVVHIPYWRRDLHLPEDIAEEIGRLNGYDTIALRMPLRGYEAVMLPADFAFQSRLRDKLTRMGMNEVLTYSFIPERLLKIANQDPAQAFRITNAISPNLQYYRLSLLPSLLEKVFVNSKAGFQEFALFEINKVHSRQAAGADGLPLERRLLSTVFTSTRREEAAWGAPYFAAKEYLDRLSDGLGVAARFEVLQAAADQPFSGPYEAARSAGVMVGDRLVGIIGEINHATARQLKLPAYTAGFELDIDLLQHAATDKAAYSPASRYQGTAYDICFRTSAEVSYQQLFEVLTATLKNSQLLWEVDALDRYQRESDTAVQTTFRFQLASVLHTITAEEARAVVNSLQDAAAAAVGATVV